MKHILLSFCVFLVGCAGSLDRLSGIRENAPEWYEARKKELAGQAYPRLSNVPVDASYSGQEMELVTTRDETEAILAAFHADPRSEPVNVSPAEIRAWGQALIAAVNARMTPADFLTDAEIASLKARFERPRARR